MKRLMLIAATAVAVTAFAQEPAVPAATPVREAPRHAVGRPDMQRSMRGMGGMGMASDPAMIAVMNPRIAEKLGLSKETISQIKDLSAAGRRESIEFQKKIREANEKQQQLMKNPKSDEAAVMAAIDEIFDARKAEAKARAANQLKIKALLTPEQIEKALEEFKNMRMARGPRGSREGELRQRVEEKKAEAAKPAAEAK